MSINNKSLCLACSSSLPPSKSQISRLFITNCCQRPICSSCITSNPRLARYDPCLACLSGVNLLASTSAFGICSATKMPLSMPLVNLSGEVRDQDVFVLGDDDEKDDEATDFNPRVEIPILNTTVDGSAQAKEADELDVFKLTQVDLPSPRGEVTSMPAKYHLSRSDTLQGLSLRFGIDMHEILKLNSLPASIIRNPNLLHTRSFLILPPNAKPHPPHIPNKTKDEGRETELVRQRAVKRLQTLTKEVDCRVAQAYVALADDQHEQEARVSKVKEFSGSLDAVHTSSLDSKTAISGTRLECLAIERYLDDFEWEAGEIRAGRQPILPRFPFGDFGSQVNKDSRVADLDRGNSRYWWPWGTY